MAIILQNVIQLLKTASGLILSQKNFAIYKEEGFSPSKELIEGVDVGIDTNQVLGGYLSGKTEEVLGGAILSGSLSSYSALASYVSECEPLSANFDETSQIMQHPLEKGVELGNESGFKNIANYVADHSIDNPRTISCRIAFPRFFQKNVHNQLLSLKQEKTLLVIVAKTFVYHKMVVQNFRHVEEPNTLERPIYQIDFREIQIQYPPESKALNPDNKTRQQV